MALRIKDNVALKELEKFGFRYSIGEDYHYYFDNVGIFIGDDLEIIISFNNDDYCELEIVLSLLNLLYDLIKADLVEKVEDK